MIDASNDSLIFDGVIAIEDFMLNDPVIIEKDHVRRAYIARRALITDDLNNVCHVMQAVKAGQIAKIANRDVIFNIEK